MKNKLQLLLKLGSLTAAMFVSASGSLAQVAPGSKIVRPCTVNIKGFQPNPHLFLNQAGPFGTSLVHTVSGEPPTHYRVSRFSDFHDTSWKPYEPTPNMQIPGSWFSGPSDRQKVVLFFQVRARRPSSCLQGAFNKQNNDPGFLRSNVVHAEVLAVFAG